MLANDWVILTELKLLSCIPRVLLGNVEVPCICSALKLDLNGSRLRHGLDS